ncbi:hypothetical protein V1318_08540 [Lysobacter sp. CCNWLW3]|uniref:hypothetical protein n=1 Tax=unclassified Lysobacter TaxID=2635362 RepID=UPI002FD560F0
MAIHTLDALSEIAGPFRHKSLAKAIGNSVFASAPGAGHELQRLSVKLGRPIDAQRMPHALRALCKYTLALELTELSGLTSPATGSWMRARVVDLAGEKLGATYRHDVEALMSELASVDAAQGNLYRHAADLLFSDLGLTDRPISNRFTWLDYAEGMLGQNIRISRTFLSGLAETEAGWMPNPTMLYRQEEHSKSISCHISLKNKDIVGFFPKNPFNLLSVRVGERGWITRPSIRAGVSQTTGEPDFRTISDVWRVSIADMQLAEALNHKLLAHSRNLRYLEMLFNAMDFLNLDLVTGPDLFPDTSQAGDPDRLAACRAAVLSQAKLGDVVLTFHRNRELARIIANLDKGSWSHMLSVTASGMALDAQPQGITEVGLDEYLNGEYRFAHCRQHDQLSPPPCRQRWNNEHIYRLLSGQEGNPYSVSGALLAGLFSWMFNRPPPKHRTPNAIAYLGLLEPQTVW